jgi:hypothetical protein
MVGAANEGADDDVVPDADDDVVSDAGDAANDADYAADDTTDEEVVVAWRPALSWMSMISVGTATAAPANGTRQPKTLFMLSMRCFFTILSLSHCPKHSDHPWFSPSLLLEPQCFCQNRTSLWSGASARGACQKDWERSGVVDRTLGSGGAGRGVAVWLSSSWSAEQVFAVE